MSDLPLTIRTIRYMVYFRMPHIRQMVKLARQYLGRLEDMLILISSRNRQLDLIRQRLEYMYLLSISIGICERAGDRQYVPYRTVPKHTQPKPPSFHRKFPLKYPLLPLFFSPLSYLPLPSLLSSLLSSSLLISLSRLLHPHSLPPVHLAVYHSRLHSLLASSHSFHPVYLSVAVCIQVYSYRQSSSWCVCDTLVYLEIN